MYKMSSKPLISAKEIEERLDSLAAEIKPCGFDVVVPLLSGSFIFAADLCRRIASPELQVSFIRASSYGNSTQSSGQLQISGLKKLDDLNGKVVAAQDGSSGASALEDALKELQKKDEKFNFKEYKKVKDYVTAKTMLESGAVDAVALDSAVALGFIEKSNGAFVTFDEPLLYENYGVGFKKGNTALRDKVEATLREMVKDGTVGNILKHWKENEAKNGGDGIDFILLP